MISTLSKIIMSFLSPTVLHGHKKWLCFCLGSILCSVFLPFFFSPPRLLSDATCEVSAHVEGKYCCCTECVAGVLPLFLSLDEVNMVVVTVQLSTATLPLRLFFFFCDISHSSSSKNFCERGRRVWPAVFRCTPLTRCYGL